jgi:pyruvate-formate lyase-activating enzyme
MPALLVADESGQIYDHPYLKLAAQSGRRLIRPDCRQLIPLPFGSQLFTMPGRVPIGWDKKAKKFLPCDQFSFNGRKKQCFPVAAFLAPGFLRTLLPAAQAAQGVANATQGAVNATQGAVDAAQGAKSPRIDLPLWAYTSVGWKDGRFWVTALQIDPNPHWHPKYFQDDQQVARAVRTFSREMPDNRLVQQLSRCALEYHCFAAKNLFLKRWECPLPTSPVCNARCLGCLSLQPGECCPSSQERITFVPKVDELVEVALPHLSVEDAIVSFGQGCEGEPLLQADTLAATVSRLRKETPKGVINLNTNGSLPNRAEEVYRAGLDSVRVSLNSLIPTSYNRYYSPCGYTFDHVIETVERARKLGLFTSINLLIFPGLTDRQKECEKLYQFIEQIGVDLIQMRNLNIDPDLYMERMKIDEDGENGEDGNGGKEGGGGDSDRGEFAPIWEIVETLRKRFPRLKLGYFNQPRREIVEHLSKVNTAG